MTHYILDKGGILILPQETITFSLDDKCTEVIWSYCCIENGQDNDNNDNNDNNSNEQMTTTKNLLESCCLLKKLTILSKTQNTELENWAHSTFPFAIFLFFPDFPNNSLLVFNGSENDTSQWKIITKPIFPSCISNVCWNNDWPLNEVCIFLKCLGFTSLNVCFSRIDPKWKKINAHYVRDLRQVLDALGMSVMFVNGVFYGRNENLFEHYPTFFEHFKQMIHYSHLLGAKSILYGSANSKQIHARRIHEYGAYKRAHNTFSSTFKELGLLASTFDITIYIKPNEKPSNYLFLKQQVEAMIIEIDMDAVKEAPMRETESLVSFGFLEYDFKLANFESFKRYMTALYLLS